MVAYKIEKAKNDKSFSMVYEGVNKECTAKDLEPGKLAIAFCHFKTVCLLLV